MDLTTTYSTILQYYNLLTKEENILFHALWISFRFAMAVWVHNASQHFKNLCGTVARMIFCCIKMGNEFGCTVICRWEKPWLQRQDLLCVWSRCGSRTREQRSVTKHLSFICHLPGDYGCKVAAMLTQHIYVCILYWCLLLCVVPLKQTNNKQTNK